MPKYFVILFSLFLSRLSPAIQSTPQHENVLPDTVKIGVYLFSVYNLDFPGNKLNADFYVWYNYKDTILKPAETFELVNSTEFHKIGQSDEKFDTITTAHSGATE